MFKSAKFLKVCTNVFILQHSPNSRIQVEDKNQYWRKIGINANLAKYLETWSNPKINKVEDIEEEEIKKNRIKQSKIIKSGLNLRHTKCITWLWRYVSDVTDYELILQRETMDVGMDYLRSVRVSKLKL